MFGLSIWGKKNIYNHWKLTKIGMIILWCGWGFQSLLESMMDTAESLCPHVMKRGDLRPELMKASSTKMVVPKCFVTQTLLEQSGVDIINKIRSVSPLHWLWRLFYLYIDFITFSDLLKLLSEVKLSLASFLSDRIVDEILEALSTSQLTLVRRHQFTSSCHSRRNISKLNKSRVELMRFLS